MIQSIAVTRRTLGLSMLALGATAATVLETEAQPIEYLSMLVELPQVAADSQVALQRLVLSTGQSWNQVYPGPVSVTVESGSMLVPDLIEKHLEIRTRDGGKGCNPANESDLFECGTGFYAETGDFGVIENQGETELSLLILFASPLETKSENN